MPQSGAATSAAAAADGVADRQQIAELIYRYCRAVDRLDIALGHSIWHDDGDADYGAALYQGDGRGVIDLICSQHRHTLNHAHQVSNILINLEGDHAGSEAYVTATLRVRQAGQLRQITVWWRYLDRWSRRNGRWGLDKRLSLRDFDEVRDVMPLAENDEGSRDRVHPSYRVLTNFDRFAATMRLSLEPTRKLHAW